MNIPFVDLKSQYKTIKNEIDNSIKAVIDDTAFIKGKFVKDFEDHYAKSYGVKNVISCANGTDAIYIALKSLNIGLGDEVITVANSWISTSETITQAGANPIFVDINPKFFTIDTSKIEKKITEKTKAIIPVHLFGHPAEMDKISELCQKYNLYLIEDCAQAHFSKWEGKNVGTFGDAGTFSFFPGKNLGAYGDAGCIITNDDKLAKKMRMYSNHGQMQKHDHEFEGINSRMDGIQASILDVKLNYISHWTELRREKAKKYSELLSSCSHIATPTFHKNAEHVFHLYVIKTPFRSKLKQYLLENGISTGIHYPVALPFLNAYKKLNHKSNDFPISHKYQSQILSLPIYPEISSSQIEYVCNTIKKFFSEKVYQNSISI